MKSNEVERSRLGSLSHSLVGQSSRLDLAVFVVQKDCAEFANESHFYRLAKSEFQLTAEWFELICS